MDAKEASNQAEKTRRDVALRDAVKALRDGADENSVDESLRSDVGRYIRRDSNGKMALTLEGKNLIGEPEESEGDLGANRDQGETGVKSNETA
jgi:hypothetical protein